MDLQELLTKMTLKLNFAESRLSQLESCHCERTCSVGNVVYRDKESWTEPDNCRTCTCRNGTVACRKIFCPPVNCSEDSLPVHFNGTCCKKCRSKCSFLGRDLSEGQRVFLQSCKECKNGVMEPVNESCPSLNCTINQRILPENRCCNVCRGHDFCAEEVLCGENSVCKNHDDKAECECESGYVPIQGDSTYCEERDECVDSQSVCDENAVCTSSVHGHLCNCKPGFIGNGTICTAVCQDACLNGGTCASPDTCSCPSGFTGRLCETGSHSISMVPPSPCAGVVTGASERWLCTPLPASAGSGCSRAASESKAGCLQKQFS
ncbi:Protein kinase C-binding protein NELL1 [Bagarius yarrelli]|uniref:Protein kinase C-binding protein NELL1 n=1 Tax=Bagarius yarrelli TaxID=175774 RepID=A0A556U335_BAGYA|nr:Protein kinase C-binding protein NELL1 [Bagarius yarrelli]